MEKAYPSDCRIFLKFIMNKRLVNRRNAFLVWFILSFLYIIITILNISAYFVDIGGDSAQYIILAENLAKARGYRMTNYPTDPFCTHYPPLFPLLLSAIIYFFGRNYYLMLSLNAVLAYFALILFYKILRKYSRPQLCILVILLLIFNWVFVLYSAKRILSEIAYFFLSCFTLYAGSKYYEACTKAKIVISGIFFTLGLILSYFCRYIGISLFVAMVIFFLSGKKKRRIIIPAISFLFLFLIWNLATINVENPYLKSHWQTFLLVDNYNPALGTIIENPRYILYRLIDGLDYYSQVIGISIFKYLAEKSNFLSIILILTFFLLLIMGFYRNMKINRDCIFNYYFLSYFLVIIMANHRVFGEGTRYLLPIMGFILFYVLSFLEQFLHGKRRKLYFLIISFLLLIQIPVLPHHRIGLNNISIPLQNFFKINYWAAANIAPDAIILSRKPTITSLITGNDSLCYKFSKPDEIWKQIVEENIEYIIADEFSPQAFQYLLPFLMKYSQSLKLIHYIGATALFKVLRDE